MEQPTPSTDLFDLHIDQQVTSYLGETAKWAKFLAILGFIMCGIIAIVALFAGSFLASSLSRFGGGEGTAVSGVLVTIIYLGIVLLYFFPCLYLFNFASKMQAAIRSNDQQLLTTSFRNLKSCYRFVGILMIIVLSFYAILLIIGIVAAAATR